MTQLGPILRAARARHGLLQDEAARKVGINPSTLSELEAGTRRPHASTAAKLAAFYGLDIETLLGNAAAPPHSSKESSGPALVRAETAHSVGDAGESLDRASDAGSASPPAGDQDTAAQRPQRPLPSDGGVVDRPVKRAPAA